MKQSTDRKAVTVRLAFDIRYLLDGISAEEMTRRLRKSAEGAIALGLLAEDAGAKVGQCEVSIVVLPEPLSEETLASFMVSQIENGQIALEDIPTRLARFGLMEPHSFVNEMRERMDMLDIAAPTPG